MMEDPPRETQTDKIESFARRLTEIVNMENVSTATIANLYGEIISQHTGTECVFNPNTNTLTVRGFSCTRWSVDDILEKLNPDSADIIKNVDK